MLRVNAEGECLEVFAEGACREVHSSYPMWTIYSSDQLTASAPLRLCVRVEEHDGTAALVVREVAWARPEYFPRHQIQQA